MSENSNSQPKSFTPAGISLLFSFLAYKSYWLAITIVIFPPIALFFGWRCYSEFRKEKNSNNTTQKLIHAVPMLVACGIFFYVLIAVNSGYTA